MTASNSTHLLLAHVIGVADTVLNRPATLRPGEVDAVMTALAARHARPSEHARRTHFAMMLMQALLHVVSSRRDGDGEAVKWEMIAAAIVPCVKADVPLALADERAQLADTR